MNQPTSRQDMEERFVEAGNSVADPSEARAVRHGLAQQHEVICQHVEDIHWAQIIYIYMYIYNILYTYIVSMVYPWFGHPFYVKCQ